MKILRLEFEPDKELEKEVKNCAEDLNRMDQTNDTRELMRLSRATRDEFCDIISTAPIDVQQGFVDDIKRKNR